MTPILLNRPPVQTTSTIRVKRRGGTPSDAVDVGRIDPAMALAEAELDVHATYAYSNAFYQLVGERLKAALPTQFDHVDFDPD